MNRVTASLGQIQSRIRAAERQFERPEGSVALLAVSKTQPAEAVREAWSAGQRAFGENHLQDAMTKVEAIDVSPIEWHFIGPVQSNKTRAIANHFDWVHSIDRLRIAERLNEHRRPDAPALSVCIQVNVSAEASKSGVPPEQTVDLVEAVSELPNLQLRGLMTIPAPHAQFAAQREALRPLRELFCDLVRRGFKLDTLSMGMTDDLEAAVAEGSTMVRIGTAIFGPRRTGGR